MTDSFEDLLTQAMRGVEHVRYKHCVGRVILDMLLYVHIIIILDFQKALLRNCRV